MDAISKHRCRCDLCTSDEFERLSTNSPASAPEVPPSIVGVENNGTVFSASQQPVPALFGTASSLTTGCQSQLLGASAPAATTPVPAPTRFTFPPQGGSLLPACQSQPLGKSDSAAARTSSPAVFTFPPRSSSSIPGTQFPPPRKSNPAATTAGLFSTTAYPCTANGQAHAVPQNNVFASSPASVFASSPANAFASSSPVNAFASSSPANAFASSSPANAFPSSSPANAFPSSLASSLQNPSSIFAQQSPSGLFPGFPGISPPLAGNAQEVPPASATVAPTFSWTTLPSFGGSITCERPSSFRPIGVPSEGMFAAFHSASAAPGSKGSSNEEIGCNPMQGKIPVMMIPVIPLPGGGFSILTVQSNIIQAANTFHQATEASPSSSVPGHN